MGFSHKSTGVGCPALLQGILPTQGLNPHPAAPALPGRLFTTAPPGNPRTSNCSSASGWKRCLSFLKMLLHVCQKSLGHICVGLFLGFLSWSVDLCVCPSSSTAVLITITSLVAQLGKSPPAIEGDLGSVPELGRSPGEGIGYPLHSWASLVAQTVKNPPAMRETWARSLGWEDPLEEGLMTYSSILAWRIPMDRAAWGATVHGHSTHKCTHECQNRIDRVPTLYFPFQNCFDYYSALPFRTHLRIILSVSTKSLAGILIGFVLSCISIWRELEFSLFLVL